jgi:hypothetical protein
MCPLGYQVAPPPSGEVCCFNCTFTPRLQFVFFHHICYEAEPVPQDEAPKNCPVLQRIVVQMHLRKPSPPGANHCNLNK